MDAVKVFWPWMLSALSAMFVVDALKSQTYWAKRTTLEWPWYYRVSRLDSPVGYWFNVIALGLLAIGCFLAPLMAGK
jgi:hypothetical protein